MYTYTEAYEAVDRLVKVNDALQGRAAVHITQQAASSDGEVKTAPARHKKLQVTAHISPKRLGSTKSGAQSTLPSRGAMWWHRLHLKVNASHLIQ